MDSFQGGNFSRATSPSVNPGLGDPERWGASGSLKIRVGAPLGTYGATGEQIIRAQAPNLLGRGWMVFCQFEAQGLDIVGPDDPRYYLDVAIGGGQHTALVSIDLLAINRNNPWFQATLNGALMVSKGAILLPQPLPASAIAITLRGEVIRAGGVILDHDVTMKFGVQIAPWSLA